MDALAGRARAPCLLDARWCRTFRSFASRKLWFVATRYVGERLY